MSLPIAPSLLFEPTRVVLAGEWTLAALLPQLQRFRHDLQAAHQTARVWDMNGVRRLDSAAAALLWRCWGQHWPEQVEVPATLRQTLERAAVVVAEPTVAPAPEVGAVMIAGRLLLRFARHWRGVVTLFGRLLLDLGYLLRHPREWPWHEFSANFYRAGAMALPVLALVGFLIGITLSYLSALQLKSFGADLFIVNILGISIIRELGPLLVAILVAGRSGSAMTAQIGVMRVTEEIDALAVMGVPIGRRVVLPKVLALMLVMPLLVVWTSAVALFGGMLAAQLQLDLDLWHFIERLPQAVAAANLYIGLSKGLVFGFVIALLACHFGLSVKPDTESLAANTTRSVVVSIILIICIDAVFAVATRGIGLPKL